jgi:hypothetical protein
VAAGDAEAGESRWLLHSLARLFALGFVGFTAVALLNDWPIGRLGNAYQLVGVLFAALALPVLSPWLATVEVHIGEAKRAMQRWTVQRREQLRVLWARLRRKPIPPITREGAASSTLGAVRTHSVGYADVDRESISEREWLAFLHGQLDTLKERVRELEAGRTADRKAIDSKLGALRAELQQHTLAVTREGWNYVATGATITALGIALTLF